MLIDIYKINDTDRSRKDFNPEAMALLVEAIKHLGLLQPIAVYEDPSVEGFTHKLVAGGRRLKAFKALHLETQDAKYACIPTLVNNDLAKSERTAELVENLVRKNMTWQEEVLTVYRACRELEHRSRTNGVAFTQVMVGELFGYSNAKVSNINVLGKLLLANDTEVQTAPTQVAALQIVASRRLKATNVKLAANAVVKSNNDPLALARMPTSTAATTEPVEAATYEDSVIFLCRDFQKSSKHLKAFGPKYCFTDIPYGIDMRNLNSVEELVAKHHDVEANVELFEAIFKTCDSVLPDDGAFFTFGDLMHFEKLLALAEKYNFRPQRWPFVLTKSGSVNQAPQYNSTKDFEVFFAFYRKDYRLPSPGPSSLVAWPSDRGKAFTHPFSKPASVVKALAERLLQPNSKVVDLFCGQGSVVKALADCGHAVLGVDIEQDHINHGLATLKGSLSWSK